MENEKITKENKILYQRYVDILMDVFIKEKDNLFATPKNWYKYYSNIQFAESFKNELDKYSVDFLNMFAPLNKLENIIRIGMPINEINEILNNIRYHCFNYSYFEITNKNIYILKTLYEQHEFAKTGYHFDYSTSKTPKSFGMIK